MNGKALIEFFEEKDGKMRELEIPLDITANDLIRCLDKAYGLHLDVKNIYGCQFVMENPVARLHGDRTLEEFGMRDGSVVICRG